MSLRHRSAARAQRGVAALIVVMVLFFIVTLVAAYTNRNLIFEQRTSANQYRSTQAYEAAQAGIEWAVSMLNAGNVDLACSPNPAGAYDTFRDRNLTIQPSGDIVARDRLSACVFNGAGWTCACPQGGTPALTAPTAPGLYPAFQVRFTPLVPNTTVARTGVIRVEAVACPKWNPGCLDFTSNAGDEGRVTLSALVSLYSGLKTPPASALTVQGTLTTGGGILTAYNQDLASGGLAVVAGGNITSTNSPEFVVSGPPGTPSSAAFKLSDPSLALPAVTKTGGGTWTQSDRMFISVFGVDPNTYRDSPGTVQMNGCPCSSEGSAGLRTIIADNPGRPVWVNGNLVLGGTADIGAAALPAVVVVSGNLSFSAPVVFHGAIYVNTNTWTMTGTGIVEGAVIAGGAMTNSGNGTYSYQPDVLTHLRLQTGSFVVVPGSWRDIPE